MILFKRDFSFFFRILQHENFLICRKRSFEYFGSGFLKSFGVGFVKALIAIFFKFLDPRFLESLGIGFIDSPYMWLFERGFSLQDPGHNSLNLLKSLINESVAEWLYQSSRHFSNLSKQYSPRISGCNCTNPFVECLGKGFLESGEKWLIESSETNPSKNSKNL